MQHVIINGTQILKKKLGETTASIKMHKNTDLKSVIPEIYLPKNYRDKGDIKKNSIYASESIRISIGVDAKNSFDQIFYLLHTINPLIPIDLTIDLYFATTPKKAELFEAVENKFISHIKLLQCGNEIFKTTALSNLIKNLWGAKQLIRPHPCRLIVNVHSWVGWDLRYFTIPHDVKMKYTERDKLKYSHKRGDYIKNLINSMYDYYNVCTYEKQTEDHIYISD